MSDDDKMDDKGADENSRNQKNPKKRSAENDVNEQVNVKKPSIVFENYLYNEEDTSEMEYFAIIDYKPDDSENEENKRKTLSDIAISRLLKSLNLDTGIIRIQKISFRRTKVQFQRATQANLLISKNDDLCKYKLKAFIPASCVVKTGVVRDVPFDITIEELNQNIFSDIPIKKIERMTRRDPDNPELRINTSSIKITFLGQTIPEEVIVHYAPRKVTYFVPRSKQCLKCGRLGHTQNFCKSSLPRCLKCGKKKIECVDCDSSKPKCILCNGTDHNCLDDKCQRKIEQNTILEIVAKGNLSYKEVQEKYFRQTKTSYIDQNSFDILDEKDLNEHFPQTLSKGPKVKNSQAEINQTLRKHHKYTRIIPGKTITLPEPTKFPTVEPMKDDPIPVTKFTYDKVTEIEKLISNLLKGIKLLAEEKGNTSILKQIEKCNKDINYMSLMCDQAAINEANEKSTK